MWSWVNVELLERKRREDTLVRGSSYLDVIESHPEWFGAGVKARNELTVFAADGSRQRPDRVVETPDGGIIIIDYKFGSERDSYLWQVRRYMGLFRGMGYASVSGYVWYVPEDKVVKV